MEKKPRLTATLSVHSGGTLLHDAVMDGDLDEVRLLLAEGLDPNAKEKSGHGWDGRTPAHIAVENDVLPALKLLASSGTNLSQPASYGSTLLHYACKYDRAEHVAFLLGKKAKVDQRDKHYGVTPLHEAARSGSLDIVVTLLAAGADPSSETRRKWHYIADGSVDIPTRSTALQVATLCGHKKVVTALEAATPAGVATNNAAANEALWKAVQANTADVQADVSTALQQGAASDVPMMDDGKTTLHHAARYCAPTVLDLLIASTLKPNLNTKDGGGFSVMHAAACADDDIGLENVKRLVAAGAKVNTSTSYGSTPLSIRANSNDRAGVEFLLDHGARIFKKTGASATPEMQAFLESRRKK